MKVRNSKILIGCLMLLFGSPAVALIVESGVVSAAPVKVAVTLACDDDDTECKKASKEYKKKADQQEKELAGKEACSSMLLAIPAWYRGMQDIHNNCAFTPLKDANGHTDIAKTAMKIGMNALQALLVVAGYVAVIMIIKGGFDYMLSTGSSDGMSSAKKTITNSIVGLIIAVLAAAIVNAIAGLIK